MIHKLADVQSSHVGQDTTIWQYVVVLPHAKIGNDCNICSHVFIENDVVVGNKVTIKNGVMIYDGVTLEDDVFVGPCVSFTNDIYPRSQRGNDSAPELVKTTVKHHASIGANATIRAGITIGEYSLIGAGAVVTKDVPPFSLVLGNPARVVGNVDEFGKPKG